MKTGMASQWTMIKKRYRCHEDSGPTWRTRFETFRFDNVSWRDISCAKRHEYGKRCIVINHGSVPMLSARPRTPDQKPRVRASHGVAVNGVVPGVSAQEIIISTNWFSEDHGEADDDNDGYGGGEREDGEWSGVSWASWWMKWNKPLWTFTFFGANVVGIATMKGIPRTTATTIIMKPSEFERLWDYQDAATDDDEKKKKS